MTILLYKGIGERTGCSNYKSINFFLSMVGKIYAGILVNKVTEGLMEDKQGGFRAGRGV